FFFFASRRRHTILVSDWSSDVCSSDLCFPRVRTLVQIQYAPDSGQLERLIDALGASSSPAGSSLEFAHDGPLLTGVRWTGAVQGNLSYVYTPEFLVAGTTVQGSPSVANTYDGDLLLIKVNIASAP